MAEVIGGDVNTDYERYDSSILAHSRRSCCLLLFFESVRKRCRK